MDEPGIKERPEGMRENSVKEGPEGMRENGIEERPEGKSENSVQEGRKGMNEIGIEERPEGMRENGIEERLEGMCEIGIEERSERMRENGIKERTEGMSENNVKERPEEMNEIGINLHEKKVTEMKKLAAEIAIGIGWSILTLWGLLCFNSFVLMNLPLLLRMTLSIILYLCMAVGPLLVMVLAKDTWTDYLFSKEKIGAQILIGIGIGIVMSMVLTLPLFLTGHGEWSDNGKHYEFLWQFLYEIVYCVGAVALTEEFIFRGFLYQKLHALSGSHLAAILVSSLAFGLFHIFGGSLVQVVMTSLIGLALCLVRRKVKNCTTLSLIIGHGLYDFLITVWVNVFL